jgi:hypothetical protein
MISRIALLRSYCVCRHATLEAFPVDRVSVLARTNGVNSPTLITETTVNITSLRHLSIWPKPKAELVVVQCCNVVHPS